MNCESKIYIESALDFSGDLSADKIFALRSDRAVEAAGGFTSGWNAVSLFKLPF